jgi:hypothetical protein
MLTKATVAAEAVPVAVGLDEAAVPGELADPEDPQPASVTARTETTASATAGASSILRRVCLICSFRPTNTPPFPPPALFAAIVAVPEAARGGLHQAEP